MKTSQQIGKDFEKTLEGVFSSLKNTHSFNYHKFIDTHAAGNIVAAQPSDYLVGIHRTLIFLEAKSSTKEKRLQKSMLRPSQRGAIKYYGMGLDLDYLVLFEHEGRVDILDGREVMRGSRINYQKSLIKSCRTEDLKLELIKLLGLQLKIKLLERIESYD